MKRPAKDVDTSGSEKSLKEMLKDRLAGVNPKKEPKQGKMSC